MLLGRRMLLGAKNISNCEGEDILFQDDDVCILKPNVKRGILVASRHDKKYLKDIFVNGLRSGQQLKKDEVEYGRSTAHPYIFFRAPFYSREINYDSINTEIISSFGDTYTRDQKSVFMFIRVDPDRTYVYSSELRVKYYGEESMVRNSRKTLSEYLAIIKQNETMEKLITSETKVLYDLFSSKAKIFSKMATYSDAYCDCPINRNSEILVRMPYMSMKYFATVLN
jgi:hypothetical protein